MTQPRKNSKTDKVVAAGVSVAMAWFLVFIGIPLVLFFIILGLSMVSTATGGK